MIIDREFFKTETRMDFEIPEMMKRAWAAELEVLKVIKDTCDSHGLSYFANAGTLLGAVRHGGFIPWDDDIDICMPRRDYNYLVTNFRELLPPGFVIAGTFGDEPRLWEADEKIQSRVMVDELVFSLPEYMTKFHGYPYLRVGIDLFPYDYMPEDIDVQYELSDVYYEAYFTEANWNLFKEQGTLWKRIERLEKLFNVNLYDGKEDETIKRNRLRRAAEKWIAVIPESKAVYITNIQTRDFGKKRNDFKGVRKERIEWYRDYVELPFECTTVRVPIDYDPVLKVIYGEDYMTHFKKLAASHEYPFYKKKEPELKRLLAESGITVSVDEFCRNWHNMNGGN